MCKLKISKVLVTGGAGYIGSHVTEQLIKKKKEVVILDNLKTGYKTLLNKKAKFVKGDISNIRKEFIKIYSSIFRSRRIEMKKIDLIMEVHLNIFIQKYNNIMKGVSMKHYLFDSNGDLVVTDPEGYVAVDTTGNAIKFVDRLEFSKANFSISSDDKFKK